MSKLLLLLSSVLSIGPAIGPIVQTKNSGLIENKNDLSTNEKIELGDIQIKDYTFDIADQEKNIETIRRMALVLASKASDSELAYNFILDFLDNPANYTVMNDIKASPGIGETLIFNLLILANSTNPSYKGLTEFTITLTNNKEIQTIDLSNIKDVIENQFIQIEQPIVQDDQYTLSVLKIIDEKLVTLEVPMFGHNDLLEWGYSTNQLSIAISNIGDITNNSGFYALNKFEISILDTEFSHFKKIEDINFKVGRTLKNKIDMEKFNPYTEAFSKASYGKYKIHTNGEVDVKNVLTAFDQYLLEYSNDQDIIDANGQLFSQEYDKKGITVLVGNPTSEGIDLIKYQFTLNPSKTSKVFTENGGSVAFTITFLIDDIHLIPTDSVNFSDGINMSTSWWGYEEHKGNKEYNILKWTKYATTWNEFISKYGTGDNKQTLNYDFRGKGSTSWGGIDSQSINGTGTVALSSITTVNKDKLGQNESINFHADAGTSKVTANFWGGLRHDNEYIILKVTFYLEIGSYAYKEVTMTGSVNNIRFVK